MYLNYMYKLSLKKGVCEKAMEHEKAILKNSSGFFNYFLLCVNKFFNSFHHHFRSVFNDYKSFLRLFQQCDGHGFPVYEQFSVPNFQEVPKSTTFVIAGHNKLDLRFNFSCVKIIFAQRIVLS